MRQQDLVHDVTWFLLLDRFAQLEVRRSTTMLTFLVQVHFVSTFANEATPLVATFELTMFVVMIIVTCQVRMSPKSLGTLAANPFGSVDVMRFEMSFQQASENLENISIKNDFRWFGSMIL